MAIDAKELRIGNWLIFDSKVVPEEFIQVTPRFFSSLAGGRSLKDQSEDTILNEYWRPIPLTPEILIACGFKLFDGTMETYDLDKFSIHLPSQYYKDGRTYFNSWCIVEGVPSNLHDLQNLYFAITKKELTYNPIIK